MPRDSDLRALKGCRIQGSLRVLCFRAAEKKKKDRHVSSPGSDKRLRASSYKAPAIASRCEQLPPSQLGLGMGSPVAAWPSCSGIL